LLDKFYLNPPVCLKKLLELALETPDARYDPLVHPSKDELVSYYCDLLRSKAKMLDEYFGIQVNEYDNTLEALPKIKDWAAPFHVELPLLCLRLAANVDYTSEVRCFQNIADELAHYYAQFIDFYTNGEEAQVKA